MRTLIDTISDKRFTQNPNNINADDYEIVNITSIDTDDFLYSRNFTLKMKEVLDWNTTVYY